MWLVNKKPSDIPIMSTYRKLQANRNPNKSRPRVSVEQIKNRKRQYGSLKRPITKVVISQNPVLVMSDNTEENQRLQAQMSNVSHKLDEVAERMNRDPNPVIIRQSAPNVEFDLPEMVAPYEMRILEEKLQHLQDNFHTQLEELREQNEVYRASVDSKDQQVQELATRLETQKQNILSRHQTLSKSLSEEISTIQQQNKAYEQQLASRDYKIEALDVKMVNMVQRVQEKQSTVDGLTEQLTQLHAQNADYKNQLGQKSEQIQQIEVRMAKLLQVRGDEYSQLHANYEKAQEDYKALQTQLESKLGNVTEAVHQSLQSKYQELNTSLQAQIEARQGQMHDLGQRMVEMKDKTTAEYQKLKEQHGGLLEDVRGGIEERKNQITDLESRIKQIHDTVSTKNESQYLQEQLEALVKQSDTYDQELKQRDGRIDALEALLTQYSLSNTQNNETIREKYESIQTEYSRLIETLEKQLESRLTDAAKNNTDLEAKVKHEYEQMRKRHEELTVQMQTQLEEKHGLIRGLETKLTSLTDKSSQEYLETKAQYDTLTEEIRHRVQEQLEERRKQLHELEDKLSKVINESNDQMKEKITELQDRSDTYSDELKKKEVQIGSLETRLTESTQALKEESKKLFEDVNKQVQLLNTEVKELDGRLNVVKDDLAKQIQDQKTNLDQSSTRIREVEEKVMQSIEARQALEKEARAVLGMHKQLDTEYKDFTQKFQTQVDALQKRYQQLHTVMLSNMEESERGNQSVQELIGLHKNMEQEYQTIMTSYDQQHEDYKSSLQEKDDRLKALESQVKEQLENVEQRIVNIQNSGGASGVGKPKHTRIDELAIPRHITPKKL